MNEGTCDGISFRISNGRSHNYIIGKYKIGKFRENTFTLNTAECLYLFFKGKIEIGINEGDFLSAMFSRISFEAYSAYEYLKNGGYTVFIAGDNLYFRKGNENTRRMIAIKENQVVSFGDFLENSGSFYFTVDEEGDPTVYMVNSIEITGRNVFTGENEDIIRAGDRFFSRKTPASWIGTQFNGLRLLTDYEARLILGDSGSGPVDAVYRDLISRGCIVKTGFKYGSHFRVYLSDIESHADLLVHVMIEAEYWNIISRAVRVASSVRKKMVFASILDEKIKYVSIERIKNIQI